jgi:hypothetical protein
MKESKWLATHVRAVSFLLLVAAFANTSLAAPGDVDLSFDPGSGVNGEIKAMAQKAAEWRQQLASFGNGVSK